MHKGGFVIIITCIFTCAGLILEPIKSGIDIGLLIVPGSSMTVDQYLYTANLTQLNSDRRLWVNIATSPLLEGARLVKSSVNNTIIGAGLEALVEAGMPQDAPYFAAGHGSSSCSLIQDEAIQYPDVLNGIILWGSSATYEFDALPCPVFTLSGDLDGVTKITTIFRTNRPVLEDIQDEPDLAYSLPTHIMEGVNHGGYATGQMPPLVVDQDIPSYLTDTQMKQIIAESTAVFLDFHSRLDTDEGLDLKQIMDDYFNHTMTVGEPIYTVFDMEQDPMTNESHWSIEAQQIVSGLPPQDLHRLLVSDYNVPNDLISEYQPELNKTPQGEVNVTTVTSVLRVNGDGYEAADMLETKMRSSQNIRECLYGVPEPEEIAATCKQVNMMAWQTARDQMPDMYKDRFDSTDVTVIFEDDEEEWWGPGWVVDDLNFDYNRTTQMLSIRSSALWVPLNSTIYPGSYYCKMLSPAKALEFMYVDGLRPASGNSLF